MRQKKKRARTDKLVQYRWWMLPVVDAGGLGSSRSSNSSSIALAQHDDTCKGCRKQHRKPFGASHGACARASLDTMPVSSRDAS